MKRRSAAVLLRPSAPVHGVPAPAQAALLRQDDALVLHDTPETTFRAVAEDIEAAEGAVAEPRAAWLREPPPSWAALDPAALGLGTP